MQWITSSKTKIVPADEISFRGSEISFGQNDILFRRNEISLRQAKLRSNDTKFRPTGTKFRNEVSSHAAKFRFDSSHCLRNFADIRIIEEPKFHHIFV